MTLTAQIPAVRKGRTTVLHPAEIKASPCELLGIVGPNGAGKSTLLRSIAGASCPVARVTWHGEVLPPRQIGYLPQAFQVSARLSVLECVVLGRRERLGWRVTPQDLADSAAVLDLLGLAHLADRPLESLSGGQQQMVLLAQRLLRQPALMVLDEPTSALDLHHQLKILSRLRAHARERSVVVVLALHDLTMAARFCDRMLLLHGGRIAACGAGAAILTQERIGNCWGVEPEVLYTRDGAPVIVPHLAEART